MVKREPVYWGQKHPKDYLLAHNPVHPVDGKQQHGVNGFRAMWIRPAWTNRKKHRFKICKRGWRPDLGKHYSFLD